MAFSTRFFTLFFFFALVSLCFVSALPSAPLVREDDEDAEGTMEPSPSAEADGADEICVDAKYLANFPSHQLVHTHAIRSAVLCVEGSTLPCATPDHMVRVNGKAMSYRALCDTTSVTCSSKRIPVNSVLSHLWTETQHDEGNKHVLTMFDARHPETVQILLHRFISMRRSVARVFS